MNRVTTLLLAILCSLAATAQQAPPQPPQQDIKNQTDYKAYVSAIQQSDPQLRAQAYEEFIEKYPNSVLKERALEQLLEAYQESPDPPVKTPSGVLAGISRGVRTQKMVNTAESLFYVDPENLNAIVILVRNKQDLAKALAMGDPHSAARLRGDADELAKRGLRVVAKIHKPASMSDEKYTKFISDVTTLFNGALIGSGTPASGQDTK